jgi:streptomycin 3"-adenylyltransferase
MTFYGWADAPADVRVQAGAFVAATLEILDEQLIGVYLHGSLAMGCFNPARSDIDLLVVTREALTPQTKRAIATMLLRRSGHPCAIEVSFLRQSDLAPWRHPTPFDLHYSEAWRRQYEEGLANDGWREWNAANHLDSDLAAHVTVMRARGICLAGAAITGVFPQPPQEDYLASLAEDLAWGIERLQEAPVYVILNMCRTLGYLLEGCILSKAEGGAWALDHLSAALHPPVIAALESYRYANDETALAERLCLGPWIAAMRAALCAAGFPQDAE